MSKKNYETALEFVRTRPNTDKGCVEILNVVIAGLEALNNECAEAHYEPDCVSCQASVVIRKLREERDDYLADLGYMSRELSAKRRALHEEQLINSCANYMVEQECLDAIEAAMEVK
jgi:hypothetical protein